MMPTGHRYEYPRQNAALFARVEASGGARLWPFPPEQNAQTWTFHKRNAVLAALADILVVVQAGRRSGAQSAAKCARALDRPILSAAAPPWMPAFAGSTEEVLLGAEPLISSAQVLAAVGLGSVTNSMTSALAPPQTAQELLRPEHERRILEALRGAPRHKDELCAITALPPSTVSMALLTLSLEHVLVEGPDGSFRRNLA